MRSGIVVLMVGFAAVQAGCSIASGSPATTPPTESTVFVTPTTSAPSTTVARQTTTTVDRLSEIQAIFEDLERRRLQALYSGNEDAFLALFVDNPYREESRRALDLVEPGEVPVLAIDVLEVLKDDADCLVIVTSTTRSSSNSAPVIDTTTLQPLDGGWGYAYVEHNRGGWLCTVPHPLSG